MSIKNNYNTLFYAFLLLHIIIWTFIPALTNINLPLDTIEALAWGSNLSWGYDKHPPLSALAVEIVFNFFGNNDWAYYLLSQIFVAIAFFYVWKFANSIFDNNFNSLISVLLLEGIYFYNFTTPEFNVNVCQLPFWSLSIYYSWKSINDKKISSFVLLGIFLSLGLLSKYLFIYLIFALKITFLYFLTKERKFDYKYFIPGIIFLIILTPHFIWLFNNDFSTFTYGFKRTGITDLNIMSHFINPIIFIAKQIGILLPMLLIGLSLLKIKNKLKFNLDKKSIFILMITLLPIIFMFITSILSGAKIRTMWITPFYLFFGVLFVLLFKNLISRKNVRRLFIIFSFFFFLSPITYLSVSLIDDYKRTDYPGKEISNLVQRRWDRNFNNKISIVVGDEWYAGNLSYHLSSRPKWFYTIENNLSLIGPSTGVIYTGNPKILKQSCPGVYGTIKPIGICMIGSR